ncbi:hypothetical protein QQF64_024659 [Cirrhinus molitorella]|uniref:Uncharacterized protein n=2 Tax=Cirrhinus molitorella TaxID=172907 RepID=A0ABR3NMT7_9TELE|nr:hypothetical protein Q8A67_000568 [Cirrhinus molitorella]
MSKTSPSFSEEGGLRKFVPQSGSEGQGPSTGDASGGRRGIFCQADSQGFDRKRKAPHSYLKDCSSSRGHLSIFFSLSLPDSLNLLTPSSPELH